VGASSFFTIKILKMIKINDKKYLTIKEYSAANGVTVQTIYNRIKDKTLSTKKILDKTLIEVK